MSGINKALLLGNLGKAPEVRFTASGKAVCNLSIATSRVYKDAAGKRQEETEWHNVVVFDKLAEACGTALKKGSKVFVEGQIKTEKWEKDGQERRSTKIYAHLVQFLDSREKNTEADTNEDVPF